MIPMAPTFCFRSVFCTPAMMAPTAAVCKTVLPVFPMVSRGWKVACCWAMASGCASVSSASSASTVDDVSEGCGLAGN